MKVNGKEYIYIYPIYISIYYGKSKSCSKPTMGVSPQSVNAASGTTAIFSRFTPLETNCSSPKWDGTQTCTRMEHSNRCRLKKVAR